ncbi:MAG TPA: LON peptidase substrate-binding domain-containing protein, partial [Myxococcota bacterium]
MSFFKSDDPKGTPPEPGRSERIIPLLPLRDIVVFPTMVVPLFVGRPKSIKALEEAAANGRELFLAAQRSAGKDEPSEEDIYRVGTLGSIIQLLRLPDQTVKVLVEGRARARVKRIVQNEPYFTADIEVLDENDARGAETEAMVRSVHQTFDNYVKLNKKVPAEVPQSV